MGKDMSNSQMFFLALTIILAGSHRDEKHVNFSFYACVVGLFLSVAKELVWP